MAMQLYSTKASRNLIEAEMTMLKHVEMIQVLGKVGVQKEHPLRKTDTIVFRRLRPFNSTNAETPDIDPNSFIAAEGVTPDANTINYTDVSVTLQNFVVLFSLSSKAELMYEDDIPNDMIELTGETLGEVAEKVAYGQIKGAATVVYANGSTRVGINSAISLQKLRLALRTLTSNRAKPVNKIINAGPNFGTSPVPGGYPVFCHSDCMSDVYDLPKCVKVAEYGTAIKPMHEREFAACEEFRFIQSPLFEPYLSAGAAVGATGMYAADSTTIDVYPYVICGQEAWGHVSLKGRGFKTGIKPTYLPPSKVTHANPAGMFGYVGAGFWYNCVRLNDNHMCVIEAAVRAL